jgi:hypothetical protein
MINRSDSKDSDDSDDKNNEDGAEVATIKKNTEKVVLKSARAAHP